MVCVRLTLTWQWFWCRAPAFCFYLSILCTILLLRRTWAILHTLNICTTLFLQRSCPVIPQSCPWRWIVCRRWTGRRDPARSSSCLALEKSSEPNLWMAVRPCGNSTAILFWRNRCSQLRFAFLMKGSSKTPTTIQFLAPRARTARSASTCRDSKLWS